MGDSKLGETSKFDTVLVVDFGAQYAQMIARRVREARVHSEIVPQSITTEEIIARKPAAVILSGGPASVFEPGAPCINSSLFVAGIPIFGICYGFQAMAVALGGRTERTDTREYGATPLRVTNEHAVLFRGLPCAQTVWMSHGDSVVVAPKGFSVVAETPGTPVAAFEDLNRNLAGVQFHPEVLHTEYGSTILQHFLYDIAGCEPTWTSSNVLAQKIETVRAAVGNKRVIAGLSGGVDSAVAATLVQRAVGNQLTCIFVDHGLLREGEADQVEKDFVLATGAELKVYDARDEFLAALKGVRNPEKKRKIIGRQFIRAFERASREIQACADEHGESVEFLVQGTLYPDVVESGGGAGTANIKSHHNVGGLPADLKFRLIEPLRDLFKDEVRQIGEELGLPSGIVWRQPFPGPGLAIRIIGAVTAERLVVLRCADAIAREELSAAGLDREVWQCPVVLLAEVYSVGVQGDGRTYGHPIVLRPVSSEDAMTADWSRIPYEVLGRISSRITNEVRGINRVVLDITSKPPATIEWE